MGTYLIENSPQHNKLETLEDGYMEIYTRFIGQSKIGLLEHSHVAST